MKEFFFKLLRFTPPIIVILILQTILYYKSDPYSDFTKKSNYSWTFSFQQLGDVSTKSLLASSRQYNSFIFGSSRSTSAYACYLETKIPNSKFFHYANWNETIGGIYKKLQLIDSLGYKVEHVVLFLDPDWTFLKEGKCTELEHYMLTGESKWEYYFKHYRSFYSNLGVDKLKILFNQKISGVVFPDYKSDPERNDHNHVCSDSIIIEYGNIKDSAEYVKNIKLQRETNSLKFKRLGLESYHPIQISKTERLYLLRIKNILEKNNTNYKIVITPSYDQTKLNLKDKKLIDTLFGETNIYDFSGKNKITKNVYNYTDPLHYNNGVSKYIIDSVFK